MINQSEKDNQEKYPWERSTFFEEYNKILGYYQAISCIENSTGNSALDLPCGDGFITEIFDRHFSRVVGVDASSAHLEQAKQRLPHIPFHESLIEELTLTEKFDNVFMINVLEHVIDPIQVLKKAASFLNKGGNLIVHVPNANAINRKIAVKMGTLRTCNELSPFDIDIAGHRRYYTLDLLQKDIGNAGLKVIKTGGVFYKMLSSPQMDWFLKQGPWEEGGFGWGRVGESDKDWKKEFSRACYEVGKEYPEECNIVYACIQKE
ncbi:class I SAM-dependent methyltransferase [Cohnella herbarum]|uniref:Class I SAM-dependent methyltransferase n=1 Tax=Cohnella herbarum TaxID=2728023 RepID=A0A7Z2VLG6_9BACL|nr:class I SAM-dependent methyltransferase [Cohnella herbarum]QJD85216.1 class I SAM-dependent methyltransferase [Cohnella herbarum]